MTDHNVATRLRQAATLTEATNWGAGWTSVDLEFLEACADIPAHELARALGRSLYAVQTARENLARGYRRQLPSTCQTGHPGPDVDLH